MQVWRALSRLVATLGPFGYSPFMPGTVGTAVGLIFFVLLRPSHLFQTLLLFLLLPFGVYTAAEAERSFKERDSSKIVIDEFVGFAVSVYLLPMETGVLIASFLFFRLFDIIKPLPISYIEKRIKGGLGVVMDDVVAGVMTNLFIRLILYVF